MRFSPCPAAPRRAGAALTLAAVALLAACGRDEVTAPTEPVAGTFTVNASTGWAYYSLAAESEVTPANPGSSAAWDMAFNAGNVMLNGGSAGPGEVAGHCLCQNAGASDAEILAMTPESELADFTAVTAAAVPAAAAFQTEALVPALGGWFTGSGAAATAATGKVWLVRLHDETRFAKLRVVALQNPTAATPGRVTLEYAVQGSAEAALGEVRTLAVVVPAEGAVQVNLAEGTTTTSTTAWDLRFEGWTVRANGGVSGSGKAAVATTTLAFDAVTTAAVDARAYASDRYAGVFGSNPWYKYNLLGDHRISPNFNVYLVRRGGAVYKVQLVNYYGPAGETRRITVRYEQIAG